MANKSYQTGEAFRKALEMRLNNLAQSQKIDISRLRRMVAFERLLAKFFNTDRPVWILKGGYAMELRLHDKARATRDIDLSVPNPVLISSSGNAMEAIHKKLRQEALKDVGDWFQFLISGGKKDLTAAPHGGARFQVEANLAERSFSKFHLDVGIGEPIVTQPEWIAGHDLLSFAGIPPVKVALLPIEQQFAEKIHAYTLPRQNPNSRTRDLVDLVLLIGQGLPVDSKLVLAIQETFKRRKTHPVPEELKHPPNAWGKNYQQMAEQIGLTQTKTDQAFSVVQKYWETLKSEFKKG